MSNPLISIVLPTRNGMATLPAVLDAIARQRIDADVEIIAIDSESTDGTADLLRHRATRLIEIAAGSFNHGLTRNQAIDAARGTFVVLLSQDAEPANDHWLDELIRPLRENDDIAGTFARQIPRPEARAITRHYHARWAASSLDPMASRVDSAEAFNRRSPVARMRACTFDNVCSCIRRDVWARHPFKATPIAEDLEWAQDVLLDRFGIAYVPGAVVIHSHERSAVYEFQRTALLHQRLYELFDLRTIPSAAALVPAVASAVRLHLACRRNAPAGVRVESLGRAVALALAWPAGQYVGGRRGARRLSAPRWDV